MLCFATRNRTFHDLLAKFILTRFNELRKVRNKTKPSGVERPFSRMYNFFVLESGDKWARTGTKFRPRNSKGFPNVENISRPSQACKEVNLSGLVISTIINRHNIWIRVIYLLFYILSFEPSNCAEYHEGIVQ